MGLVRNWNFSLACLSGVVLCACAPAAGIAASRVHTNITPAVSHTATVSVPAASACSTTNGSLALKVSTVRTSGISPLLVFFDATGTTDSSISGKTTAFQDISYTWDFGDSGASGTGTWAYGANRGKNSRNTATGGVAAHLYVAQGDTTYTVNVTTRNGSNTASCQLGVTAFDPAGTHGFAGAKTACASASGRPVPGSGGCPSGAAVINTSSFNTALGSTYFGSGKRVLFKCGDTFTGDNAILSGTKWSIGAYGGCEGTRANRPIIQDSGVTGQFTITSTDGDGRIADLDFEGNGATSYAIENAGNSPITYQMTLYNLLSNANDTSFAYAYGAQWGIIDSVSTGMKTKIGTFLNYGENDPAKWTGNVFNNVDYHALIGNLFNGGGGTNGSSGQETVRISACRLCAIENNTIENANNIGAVLKIHNGNTNNSVSTWSGVYTELIEISDNWFGGTSGAQTVENAPQNGSDDERLRNIVVERNIFSAATGAQGGKQLLVSAINETVRNNVFNMPGNTSLYAIYGVQVAQRGIEPVPRGVEVYNNTCYAPNAVASQRCVGLDNIGGLKAPAINSFAQNNLFYIPAGGHSAVVNTGNGNTIGNNTASPSSNPVFTNGSGSFSLLSDFKPTTNYSGGTSVPAWYDALGVLWAPIWDLGAVHH